MTDGLRLQVLLARATRPKPKVEHHSDSIVTARNARALSDWKRGVAAASSAIIAEVPNLLARIAELEKGLEEALKSLPPGLHGPYHWSHKARALLQPRREGE